MVSIHDVWRLAEIEAVKREQIETVERLLARRNILAILPAGLENFFHFDSMYEVQVVF